jgi:peptide-methionine (S)-S-oxide reductase
VQLAYDPTLVSYDELMATYWSLVRDPTSAYRQGVDVGTQYEPCIFFHSDQQREAALASRGAVQAQLAAQRGDSVLVVTRVRPAEEFWVAEDEHQVRDG